VDKLVRYAENGLKGRAFPTNSRLVRSGVESLDYAESTPVDFDGRLLLLASARLESPANDSGKLCLWVVDTASGAIVSTFAPGYSLASALVHGGALHVWAIPSDAGGARHIDHFRSADLVRWDRSVALEALPGEELFNESVCRAGDRFVMAFEARDAHYPPFTIYFAESRDLETWTRVPRAVFGTDRYTACPALRHVDGVYYMLYLEHRTPLWWFETFVARSRDLVTWELGKRNPVLAPDPDGGERINTSDPDLIELPGPRVRLHYLTGNQQGYFTATWADFDGSLKELLESYF
jgi:hypothetical protein